MERTVFFNGSFIPESEAKISVFDRGFMFSDGIYEVVRFYNGQLFANELHLSRLKRSLAEIQLTDGSHNWTEIFNQLIYRNGLLDSDGIVYLQISRGVADRDHPFPSEKLEPTCFAYARTFARPVEKFRKGVKVITLPDERWARCDIKSVSLLANVLAQQKAKIAGVQEAVLYKNNIVTEGSRSNFFAVFDGTLYTHPKTHDILPGVQREVILQLADSLNLAVRQERFTLSDFLNADEIFISSTTSEVMPVIQVDDVQIADGTPGAVTGLLQKSFEELLPKPSI